VWIEPVTAQVMMTLPWAAAIVANSMKIEIRRAEPGDYKAVQQVHAQPRAIWGTLQLPFPSEEVWKKRLAEGSDEMYALVACAEAEIVAMAGLHLYPKWFRRRHVGGIGMAVHDKWQSRGVGTALMNAIIDLADNWLNVTRLELSVWTDNEPALRLYKKFGFEIEGTHRKYAFRDGAYVDAYAMARVR
jgi:putative acetyltransferase